MKKPDHSLLWNKHSEMLWSWWFANKLLKEVGKPPIPYEEAVKLAKASEYYGA